MSQGIYYDSAGIYVATAATLQEKIAKMDAIITALETSALAAAANNDVTEYQLDDGQTRIRCVYRSAEEVQRSIDAFEKIRQRYINRLNGRVVRLVDHKNLRRRW